MLVLIVVGFAAGVITSLSPCVLPVLPVVLAANANNGRRGPSAGALAAPTIKKPGTGTGTSTDHDTDHDTDPAREVSRRDRFRPYLVVAGLVISFSASVLFGSVVLSALHLPQDLLRDAGIVVLAVIGLSLLWPRLAHLLERPFARLPSRTINPDGNGLVLGLGLGLLFVPCAGPVLATIAVVGATHRVGFSAIVLTAAFGIGAGVPLLAVALAGDMIVRRTSLLRRRARTVRLTSGIVMILAAALIGLNLTDGLQRHVPGYTTAMQNSLEGNTTASQQLRKLTTGGSAGKVGTAAANGTAGQSTTTGTVPATPDENAPCTEGGSTLENCGQAPDFADISTWLNTPDGKPLSLTSLHGKVVLIDFWTYSCINCQRTLPHVESWYNEYNKDGFVVVGVHTPEFAFEHVTSNVRSQAAALGVKYPIAIDNDYGTWNAWGNQYWPAEYLLDGSGVVRHVSFGEGDYSGTENLIRQLLNIAQPGVALPKATDVPDTTPTEQQSPETYLGYQYQQSISGTTPVHDKATAYSFPTTLKPNTFALAGTWTAGSEDVTAGASAKLELRFQADKVYLVLGGTGAVGVQVNGVTTKTVSVSGTPKLYTLVDGAKSTSAVLTLTMSPGVQAYDFTFG